MLVDNQLAQSASTGEKEPETARLDKTNRSIKELLYQVRKLVDTTHLHTVIKNRRPVTIEANSNIPHCLKLDVTDFQLPISVRLAYRHPCSTLSAAEVPVYLSSVDEEPSCEKC